MIHLDSLIAIIKRIYKINILTPFIFIIIWHNLKYIIACELLICLNYLFFINCMNSTKILTQLNKAFRGGLNIFNPTTYTILSTSFLTNIK